MVTEDHQEILQKILGLTDTACQADLELMEQFAVGNEEARQIGDNDGRIYRNQHKPNEYARCRGKSFYQSLRYSFYAAIQP